jgi:hypothetical protein
MRSTDGNRAALTVCVAAASLTAQQSWTCSKPPVETCAKRHGRLSSQNGIPLRLWLIGTKQVFAVANSIESLPSEVRPYLEMTSEDHSYIYGDFVVCPLELDAPGNMRQACLTGAEKLVVQPLRRPGPSFRVLSTWPTQD